MTNSIYTDLACESRELNPDISGVSEETETVHGISISRISIHDGAAADKLQKRIGTYITLDAPELCERELTVFKSVAEALSRELAAFTRTLGTDSTVLVAGLGNRNVTPDSLGPRSLDGVFVTRHIKEHLPDAFDFPLRSVCALWPGVLGTTGIETLETLRGTAQRVRPDMMIVIDALASRRASRISTTIQLTDAGISPGGGVGNARAEINEDTFGVPVIAIGVPTVVHAATISIDAVKLLKDELGVHESEERIEELTSKVIDEHFGPMVVTPKDIDRIVADMAAIISDGINMALHKEHVDDIKSLVT